MSISRCRRCSRDFWLCKFVGIYVKNIGVIKIGVTLGFSCKVVTAKDNDGGTWQCCRVPSSGTWTDTLNDGISPLPPSDLKFFIWILAWWLMWILALSFLLASLALGITCFLTVLRMFRLLHLFQLGFRILLLLILVLTIFSILLSLFWVIGGVVTFHLFQR